MDSSDDPANFDIDTNAATWMFGRQGGVMNNVVRQGGVSSYPTYVWTVPNCNIVLDRSDLKHTVVVSDPNTLETVASLTLRYNDIVNGLLECRGQDLLPLMCFTRNGIDHMGGFDYNDHSLQVVAHVDSESNNAVKLSDVLIFWGVDPSTCNV